LALKTRLLAEIKDVRDEINIIRRVLTEQKTILPDFVERITDEIGDKRRPESHELRKKSKEQVKIIETSIGDLQRMDKQAEIIYLSLTNLLDLKQKHANAFEARFARDQAALTARQGQTIMVFTIVTIIFLPISTIASFFNIQVKEFPQSDGQQSLPLGYVFKYMFGIGLGISIPLIFLALAVDDVFGALKSSIAWTAHLFGARLKPKDSSEDEDAVWTSRYTESKYSNLEKEGRRSHRDMERESRSSINRDISPLSDRSHLNYMQNAHIMWARNSYDRPRRGSITT